MNPKDLEKYQEYYYTNSIWQIKVIYLYQTINGYIFESNGVNNKLSYSEVREHINDSNLNKYSSKELELYNKGISKGIELGFELSQRWIPISKSLSNVNERVLVISKKLNVYLCYLNNDGKFHNTNNDCIITVIITHWMYLELPK